MMILGDHFDLHHHGANMRIRFKLMIMIIDHHNHDDVSES